MTSQEVLNHLISVCADSEKRYQHAALDVGKEYLARFFNDQAMARRRAAEELRGLLRIVGGSESNGGTIVGTADALAMDANVVMSMGDTGVVDWCRKDAQAVIKQYEQILHQDLSPQIRDVLMRQLGEVRATVADMESVLAIYGGARSQADLGRTTPRPRR